MRNSNYKRGPRLKIRFGRGGVRERLADVRLFIGRFPLNRRHTYYRQTPRRFSDCDGPVLIERRWARNRQDEVSNAIAFRWIWYITHTPHEMERRRHDR